MGMFGKIGSALKAAGSNFQANGGFNGLAAAVDDTPGAWQDFQAQRQKQAQEQQQQQALAALMQRMRPQDTQTPVINNMIDMNNQRMAGYDGGAAIQSARQDVGKAGLDFTDPETLKAFMGYASMPGANAQLPLALSQMLQPEKPPEPKFFNTRNAVVAVDPESMQARPIYEAPVDPLDAQYRQAQIASVRAQEQQRLHAAKKPYFAPPRAGAGPAAVSTNPWDKYKR